MKWQWKLARIAGIDIYVHATFVLIIGWVALTHWIEKQSLAHVLSGVAFILSLFLLVVMHEYGHALTARKFGVKTRDITLYPIGGVARLERMPEKPIEELWVALAGPAVNVVLAILLFAYLVITNTLEPLSALTVTSGSFVERLMVVNLLLAGFNMLPAFPMDGGRVLRALLAMRLEYTRATQVAASIGQGMALLFGFWGLFANPFMLFIAFFVWIGAAQEASMVQMKNSLGNIPVNQAMQTDFRSLSPEEPLSQAAQMILEGAQHDFPVTENGQVIGLLTRDDLMLALARQGQNTPVATVMRRSLPYVDSYEMLENALMRLQEAGIHSLPILHNGQLVGLLTSENVTEFLMIRRALGAARQPA
jgi:Zn-dependent protease